MSLKTDDLNLKYGGTDQNVMESKKKRKKSKGRAVEVDFTLLPNGLVQSYEPNICYDANGPKVVSAYSTDTAETGNDYVDVTNQLLQVVRSALQEFFFNVGNNPYQVEDVIDFLSISDIAPRYKQILSSLNNAQLYNFLEKLNVFRISYKGSKMVLQKMDEPSYLKSSSDTATSQRVSSLSKTNNDQLLTLLKGNLNSISDAVVAQTKPLSVTTNNFTKLPHRYLNGTQTVGSELETTVSSQQRVLGDNVLLHKRSPADELVVQQNGDNFYDQNIELMQQRLHLQDGSLQIERKFMDQRLKDLQKKYEERLFLESLKLKKAYKEILDLRLGKAKALANKRIGQAELALKHASTIHSRIDDETVRLDIKQVIGQWEQILREYKTWHANLDRIVDGQKAQVDSNYNFDELALLTPPDNIPCAPQLPPNAMKYMQQLESGYNMDGPSSELLRVIGSPMRFEEKEPVADGHGRFGAIGQPALPPQRKILTKSQIDELVERTMEHFQKNYGNTSILSEERVRSVISEFGRLPLTRTADTSLSSITSYIIRHAKEFSDTAGGGSSGSQPSTPSTACWASLSSEPSTIHRAKDVENQECKICLVSLAHCEKLIECPSCSDSYHYECGIKWLRENSTCPNCRRLWSNPDDFPTLTTASQ